MAETLSDLLGLYTTRMKEIPAGLKRGWEVILERADGIPIQITDLTRLSLVHPKFGRVTYGEHPNGGYDAWAIHEPGGGGSCVLPFIKMSDGSIFVGLLFEKRMLQTKVGMAWNTVMGFLEPGQSHFETAVGELGDETGIKPLTDRVHLLPGHPGNHNSSNEETWGLAPDGQDEGMRFYSYEVLPSEVEGADDDDENLQLKAGLHPKPGVGEKIAACKFMYWKEAVRLTGDMQTMSAIGRLVAEKL